MQPLGRAYRVEVFGAAQHGVHSGEGRVALAVVAPAAGRRLRAVRHPVPHLPVSQTDFDTQFAAAVVEWWRAFFMN